MLSGRPLFSMTPEQLAYFQAHLNQKKLEIQALQRIADLLERAITLVDQLLTQSQNTPGPRYMATAKEFKTFDWGAIGAEILRRDRDQLPDLVKWKDQIYSRRAKPDQDGNIWFSRSLGNGEYDVLIRFVEPPRSKRLDF